MSVIQVEVDDQVIQEIGKETINDLVKNQIDYLKMRYLGDKFRKAIEDSGIDHEKEFKAARQEAWDAFKAKHLKVDQ